MDEVLKGRILNLLYYSKEEGITVESIIHELGTKLTTDGSRRYKRDSITKFLKEYAKDHPDDIYVKFGADEVFLGKASVDPKGRRYRWKLKSKAKLLTTDTRALILAITKRFAAQILPPDERGVVEDLCSILGPSGDYLVDWADLIDVVPRYPPLYLKTEDIKDYEITEKIILGALRHQKGFQAHYLSDSPEIYYPVRLVRREWVTYCICAVDQFTPVYREFAVHRFTKVSIVDLTEGNNLSYKAELIKKNMEYHVKGNWEVLEKLVFKVTGPPAQHMAEMRFHDMPYLKEVLTEVIELDVDENSNRIKAATIEVRDVPYTYELKCWLLGLGVYLKVINAVPKDPKSKLDVIGELRKEIEGMVKNYC